ncbi:MAG: helix-turn-helix transcriptional regulator [Acidobacteria bacterium]|nr:helix-turn-helix transcriptional regulator [Acidobacteriota bacterium]
MLRGLRPFSHSYPKSLNTLGDHLRKKRLDLGLLQREVAVQIGVDQDTIWNWESNATHPALPLIPKVIEFLGYALYVRAACQTEKLSRFRKTRGMSIKEMAGHLGVDPSTVAGWEAERHRPGRRYRRKIRGFFSNGDYRENNT